MMLRGLVGGSSCPHVARGVLDGADDPLVAGAAAQIATDAFADRVLVGIGGPLQELISRHDHPRRAVPALETVLHAKAFLQWMQLAVTCESFDRQDLAAVSLPGQH